MRLASVLYSILAVALCAQETFCALPGVVQPSPGKEAKLELPSGARILDFDMSRFKPQAVILLAAKDGSNKIMLWNIGEKKALVSFVIPQEYAPESITVHPNDDAFFMLAQLKNQSVILRISRDVKTAPEEIFKTSDKLRRLVMGPRPYTHYEGEKRDSEYRLYFGVEEDPGVYSLNSIRESGNAKYQVLGPKPKPEERKELAPYMEMEREELGFLVPSALPLGFHPAGHVMFWSDAEDCFHKIQYGKNIWDDHSAIFNKKICGGSVTSTPNGLGILHWRKNVPGVTLYLDSGKTEKNLASSYTFTSMPSSTPDGKGLVGEIRNGSKRTLVYVPLNMPLADVANAWMFQPDGSERDMFERNGGLFRDTNWPQLYQFYETEHYSCGGNAPVLRPYLVTTDIFWEIFGAAFQGLFVRREEDIAIPAFREFVSKAYQQLPMDGRLHGVFGLLQDLNNDKTPQPESELDKVLNAAMNGRSELLGVDNFQYTNLKPNSHYTATPEKERYFKAFRYLGMVPLTVEERTQLKALPLETRQAALTWINSYRRFIAPPRAPEIFGKSEIPAYSQLSRKTAPTLFPLSWGIDNEILNATVFHPEWPLDLRVENRWLPSGLDLASVLGSSLAEALLEQSGEFSRYPNLKNALSDLKKRLSNVKVGDNLYDKWINALAVQWNDEILKKQNLFAGNTWPVKRLQTGLASWTTLRHITVLVNERSVAECGEGGFEDIEMEKPLGYVEPDPATFDAIAGLFDSMAETISSATLPGGIAGVDEMENAAYTKGMIERLRAMRDKTAYFAALARKELAGEALTEDEYEEIQYVARTAEYNFLIFKSIMNEDMGIAIPDPMPKIVDVAGNTSSGLLMSAIGYPLEWDAITPYFGRRQITKGAAYSYYEFPSKSILNDKEWLDILPKTRHPVWFQEFITPKKIEYHPAIPF